VCLKRNLSTDLLSRLVFDGANDLPRTDSKKPQPSVPTIDPEEERRLWAQKRIEARERRKVEETQSFDLMSDALIMTQIEVSATIGAGHSPLSRPGLGVDCLFA
jgi:hypothetical protein